MADEITNYTEQHERTHGVRKRPQSLLARGSRAVRVEVRDEDGGWRSIIKMSRNKFGDQEKGIFLEEYRKWGRMGESAASAGVSTATVRKHIHEDELFAEALMMCEEEYADKLIGHHQDLVFNGQIKESYDRQGNLMSSETVYPIRLIEMELKKHDEGYRDKQELKVNHTGGVLIAPAEVASVEDWEQRFKKVIDVTPETLPIVEDEED